MKKTSIDIENLVRPNIRALAPYRSARDDFSEGLLLDANENSYGPPFKEADALNRYPSPYQPELRGKLAEFRNVKTENVFTGVGSDEAIDLLFRIFCNPGSDNVIVTPPTYGMYKVSAAIHDVEVRPVLLTKTFQPEADRILEAADAHTKMLFLCSPNNPTGNDFGREELLRLIRDFPGLVIVDEAYIDFSELDSMAGRVTEFPNLVVMQTMSKSFGLAGIRLGVAYAPELIVSYLMKVKPPYNINSLTSRYALEAFEHMDTINLRISKIKREKVRLFSELERMRQVQQVFPSDANFILFRIKDALNTYRNLAENGVIVRYRGNEPHCENCLRVSVGTPDDNNLFLSKLREVTNEAVD